MKDETNGFSWTDRQKDDTGGHSVVATPVIESLPVNGLPAKITMAEALFYGLNGVHIRELPDSVTAMRLADALESLIYLRVKQIRHERVNCPSTLHFRQIRYPAFMWDILRAIGDIRNPDDAVTITVDLGDKLKSKFEPTSKGGERSKFDWSNIAETIATIDSIGTPNGLQMATALPKMTDGSISVLSFFINDRGHLTSASHALSHGHALVRAACDFQFSLHVWGIPRWEYNSVEWYYGQLQQIVRGGFKTLAR